MLEPLHDHCWWSKWCPKYSSASAGLSFHVFSALDTGITGNWNQLNRKSHKKSTFCPRLHVLHHEVVEAIHMTRSLEDGMLHNTAVLSGTTAYDSAARSASTTLLFHVLACRMPKPSGAEPRASGLLEGYRRLYYDKLFQLRLFSFVCSSSSNMQIRGSLIQFDRSCKFLLDSTLFILIPPIQHHSTEFNPGSLSRSLIIALLLRPQSPRDALKSQRFVSRGLWCYSSRHCQVDHRCRNPRPHHRYLRLGDRRNVSCTVPGELGASNTYQNIWREEPQCENTFKQFQTVILYIYI